MGRYRRPGSYGMLYGALNSMQRRNYQSFQARTGTQRRTRFGLRRGGVKVAYKRNYQSRGGTLGGTNANVRSIYRRKRMPSRKKKNWKRFVQKVNAISEKELGTRTILFNDFIRQSCTVDGTQGALTLALYGNTNTQRVYMNDLKIIANLENTGDETAVKGINVDLNTTKIMFQSAIFDLTLRNSSTVQDAPIGQDPPVRHLDGSAAMELDVYEVYIRKELDDVDGPRTSLSTALDSFDAKEVGGTGAGIEIRHRGATPFEFGHVMGRLGIKILKKTKYFIPNNQTITHQIRDPKRHVATLGQLDKTEGWVQPGWTRTLFLIYKLVPGLIMGDTTDTYQAQIDVGVTRKYSYKLEGANDCRERRFGDNYYPPSQS